MKVFLVAALFLGLVSAPGYAAQAGSPDLPIQFELDASYVVGKAKTPFASPGGEGMVYVVQADDTLWKLAEKYLGDGNRYTDIVEATRTKRDQDSSFALIDDSNLIAPGSKLWIPTDSVVVEVSMEMPSQADPESGLPGGHIAFSFWNNAPDRCTYEIDIIDVSACLGGFDNCQSSRRIFAYDNVSEPALSPGGDRLAFQGWGQPAEVCDTGPQGVPPFSGRSLANSTLDGTDIKITGGFQEDSHPDWSPDGQRVIFDSQRHTDRIDRIFVIGSDGSGEQDLRIAGQQPSWSPDGNQFVYRGCDLTGNRCGLWVAAAFEAKSWEAGINMVGSVLEDDQAAHPDWSPVSDEIVYQTPVNGSWDLMVVEAGGGDPRSLTSDPGIEGLPSWSPNGEWVAYLSDNGGDWGIWIVSSDGSQRHLLFPFDGGIFSLPQAAEPYGARDWLHEQISWAE